MFTRLETKNLRRVETEKAYEMVQAKPFFILDYPYAGGMKISDKIARVELARYAADFEMLGLDDAKEAFEHLFKTGDLVKIVESLTFFEHFGLVINYEELLQACIFNHLIVEALYCAKKILENLHHNKVEMEHMLPRLVDGISAGFGYHSKGGYAEVVEYFVSNGMSPVKAAEIFKNKNLYILACENPQTYFLLNPDKNLDDYLEEILKVAITVGNSKRVAVRFGEYIKLGISKEKLFEVYLQMDIAAKSACYWHFVEFLSPQELKRIFSSFSGGIDEQNKAKHIDIFINAGIEVTAAFFYKHADRFDITRHGHFFRPSNSTLENEKTFIALCADFVLDEENYMQALAACIDPKQDQFEIFFKKYAVGVTDAIYLAKFYLQNGANPDEVASVFYESNRIPLAYVFQKLEKFGVSKEIARKYIREFDLGKINFLHLEYHVDSENTIEKCFEEFLSSDSANTVKTDAILEKFISLGIDQRYFWTRLKSEIPQAAKSFFMYCMENNLQISCLEEVYEHMEWFAKVTGPDISKIFDLVLDNPESLEHSPVLRAKLQNEVYTFTSTGLSLSRTLICQNYRRLVVGLYLGLQMDVEGLEELFNYLVKEKRYKSAHYVGKFLKKEIAFPVEDKLKNNFESDSSRSSAALVAEFYLLQTTLRSLQEMKNPKRRILTDEQVYENGEQFRQGESLMMEDMLEKKLRYIWQLMREYVFAAVKSELGSIGDSKGVGRESGNFLLQRMTRGEVLDFFASAAGSFSFCTIEKMGGKPWVDIARTGYELWSQDKPSMETIDRFMHLEHYAGRLFDKASFFRRDQIDNRDILDKVFHAKTPMDLLNRIAELEVVDDTTINMYRKYFAYIEAQRKRTSGYETTVKDLWKGGN